jgi:hypothetical protein
MVTTWAKKVVSFCPHHRQLLKQGILHVTGFGISSAKLRAVLQLAN